MSASNDINATLEHLRLTIHRQGYTQLQIQESLRLGRSYISQLLTKQKSLRIEQLLAILGVIGVEPGEFFARLFKAGPRVDEPLARRLERLLAEKQVISEEELEELERKKAS